MIWRKNKPVGGTLPKICPTTPQADLHVLRYFALNLQVTAGWKLASGESLDPMELLACLQTQWLAMAKCKVDTDSALTARAKRQTSWGWTYRSKMIQAGSGGQNAWKKKEAEEEGEEEEKKEEEEEEEEK